MVHLVLHTTKQLREHITMYSYVHILYEVWNVNH